MVIERLPWDRVCVRADEARKNRLLRSMARPAKIAGGSLARTRSRDRPGRNVVRSPPIWNDTDRLDPAQTRSVAKGCDRSYQPTDQTGPLAITVAEAITSRRMGVSPSPLVESTSISMSMSMPTTVSRPPRARSSRRTWKLRSPKRSVISGETDILANQGITPPSITIEATPIAMRSAEAAANQTLRVWLRTYAVPRE